MSKHLERRIAVISLIPRYPGKITTTEIMGALDQMGIEISRRTIQNDMQMLCKMSFLGVESDPQDEPINQEKQYYIAAEVRGMEVPRMSPTATTVLMLAHKYLRSLLPGVVVADIDRYFERANAMQNRPGQLPGWQDVVAVVPKALPLMPPPYNQDLANVVFEALNRNRQLTLKVITRHSPTEPKSYRINPLGVVVRDSSIYLVWTLDGDREEKVKEFALHRIQSATMLEIPRDLPHGFTLDGFINEHQGFGYLVQDEPEEIRLVMKVGSVLQFTLSETALSNDQTIEQLDQGLYRVTATVKNTHQLRAWIRERGTQALVLEPPCVREDLKAQYEALARMYGAGQNPNL